jgi:hypothetical protein
MVWTASGFKGLGHGFKIYHQDDSKAKGVNGVMKG